MGGILSSMNQTQVFIPSRKRPFNVERMRSFFDDAIWWVHESESEDYIKAGVPESLLKLHQDRNLFAVAVNGIMDYATSEGLDALAIADDDLEDVWSVPSERKLHPSEVPVIVDNMRQLLEDLDLCMGAFSHEQAVRAWGTNHGNTFRVISCIRGLWVYRGKGLASRRYRTDLAMVPSLDLSLRALEEDRAVLADKRFLVNLGKTFNNPGGMTGLISEKEQKAAVELYRELWGGAVEHHSTGITMELGSGLRRQNPRAPTL